MDLCPVQRLKGEDVSPGAVAVVDASAQDVFPPQPMLGASLNPFGLSLEIQSQLHSSSMGGAGLMPAAANKRPAEGEPGGEDILTKKATSESRVDPGHGPEHGSR